MTTQVEAYDHKMYYPGADKLRLRVTGDAQSGRLLGAQIVGHWKAEVAKRIDVFATALFHHMDVDEMNSLDLSYTPPLASPWDAIQVAAQAWTAGRRKHQSIERRKRDRMKRLLVLCTGNSARSQMGEGLFRQEGRGGYEVESAGTKPSQVRPEAIAVMKELGIDISGHRSKSVNEFDGQSFDYVVTVCDNARDNCPVFPAGTERIHWSFEDPAAVQGTEEQRISAFRRIRDQIHEKVRAFFGSHMA